MDSNLDPASGFSLLQTVVRKQPHDIWRLSGNLSISITIYAEDVRLTSLKYRHQPPLAQLFYHMAGAVVVGTSNHIWTMQFSNPFSQ